MQKHEINIKIKSAGACSRGLLLYIVYSFYYKKLIIFRKLKNEILFNILH
jgi:hypothetical protein